VKTAENPFFKKNYADLAAILDVVDGPMSNSGLAFIAWSEYRDGILLMVGRIEHTDGEFREGVFPLFGNKPQDIGSSITYARRYLLQSLLNLAAEDDDGNDASGVEGKAKPPQQIKKTGSNNQASSLVRKPVETNGKKLDDEINKFKIEYGRLISSKDTEGNYIFSEPERVDGKESLRSLIPDTSEERKRKLELILEEVKKKLQSRTDSNGVAYTNQTPVAAPKTDQARAIIRLHRQQRNLGNPQRKGLPCTILPRSRKTRILTNP
jgi:hypothetical protein